MKFLPLFASLLTGLVMWAAVIAAVVTLAGCGRRACLEACARDGRTMAWFDETGSGDCMCEVRPTVMP